MKIGVASPKQPCPAEPIWATREMVCIAWEDMGKWGSNLTKLVHNH